MKFRILIIVFLFHFTTMNCQTDKQIDSLYHVIKTTTSDSVRFVSYNKIAFHYIFNDASKALRVLNDAERKALRANSIYGYAKLINTHGIYMDVKGESDSAEYYFNKALRISKTHKFLQLESFCINNLGMFYWNKGNFNKALLCFFNALKINEKSGASPADIAINYNNIGLIYQQMNMFEKALVFHQKAYQIREASQLEKEQATSLNNIGLCYKSLGKVKLAISVFRKALTIAQNSKNFIDYYKILENIGDAYLADGDYDQAVTFYTLGLGSGAKSNRSLKNRIAIYSGLIAAYNQKNQPDHALEFAKKGFFLLAKHPEYRNFSENLYRNAAHSYYLIGDYQKGKHYSDEFIQIRDSIFSQNNANAVAGLEVKYETEKKEHDLAESRAIVAERELEIKKKNNQVLVLAIGSLFIFVVAYLLYTQQKLRNKQLRKENQLKDAMAEIETQNHLQQQRLLISRDLHDNIGAQLTVIISSLDNLKLLELPKEKLNTKIRFISDFTIATIYELRDTIWAMNKNDITFDDLKSRITSFINNAKSSKENILFEFVIADTVNLSHTFSSVQGMNMYRIIQESVNNALKYARADTITVSIDQPGISLVIEVSDDGVGFDVENADFGNGLYNMKKRAKELQAVIEITSATNQGTRIRLEKALA